MNAAPLVKTLTVTIFMALMVGVVAMWFATREPSYDVTVASKNGVTSVTWSSCDGGRAVNAYYVSIVAEEGGERDFVCRVLPADGTVGHLPLVSEWQYGTAPNGYELDGSCPPLGPGGAFRVRVGGRIGGSAVFRIRQDGQVDVVERSCWRLFRAW